MEKCDAVYSGQAWVGNGFRAVFNAREIKRGKNKGSYYAFYFTGSRYKRVVVKELKPSDTINDFEGEKCTGTITRTQ